MFIKNKYLQQLFLDILYKKKKKDIKPSEFKTF